MESIFNDSTQSLLVSLVFGLVAVLLSVGVVIAIDRFMYRSIDFVEEMKKGNMAASLFYCVQLLFVGIIVAVAIH